MCPSGSQAQRRARQDVQHGGFSGRRDRRLTHWDVPTYSAASSWGRCRLADLRDLPTRQCTVWETIRVRRGRIDYRMARRALVRDVKVGLLSPREVCDAHPDLVRAGRNVGETTDDACPICAGPGLRLVTYVFGKEVGRNSGKVVPRTSLEPLTQRYGDLNVYTVEVCTACCWHHLRESFWLAREAG